MEFGGLGLWAAVGFWAVSRARLRAWLSVRGLRIKEPKENAPETHPETAIPELKGVRWNKDRKSHGTPNHPNTIFFRAKKETSAYECRTRRLHAPLAQNL